MCCTSGKSVTALHRNRLLCRLPADCLLKHMGWTLFCNVPSDSRRQEAGHAVLLCPAVVQVACMLDESIIAQGMAVWKLAVCFPSVDCRSVCNQVGPDPQPTRQPVSVPLAFRCACHLIAHVGPAAAPAFCPKEALRPMSNAMHSAGPDSHPTDTMVAARPEQLYTHTTEPRAGGQRKTKVSIRVFTLPL